MTDRISKFLLAAVFVLFFAGLFFCRNRGSEIATTKQAVVSSQATADRAKSEYVAIKDRNIQQEKEVAKNAVQDLCKMYSDDGDALIGWAELVARARRYNGQWSDSTD